ncbi:MAG: hypothetical protein PHT62_10995 [Desulfotomaculaceae bacterium]|nr:hypothetical protein [Desulfotomaculaceae bacterium]
MLIALEFVINVKASLNLSILYSFRGQFQQAIDVTDFQWLLFYPCVYAYSVWQAYNRAREINRGLSQAEEGRVFANTQYNGLFIGFAMGGTLGVIYICGIGPIFGGILGGFMGGLTGYVVERLVKGMFCKGQD